MLARHQNETERSADAPTSPLQDLDRRGEVVTTTCSTFDLLGLYTALEEPDDILRADSAEDDLKTLDSTLFWEQFTRENPRRSSRLVAKLPSNQPLPDKRKRRPDSELDNHPVKNRRVCSSSPRKVAGQDALPSQGPSRSKSGWLDKNKQLIAPTSSWNSRTADNSAVLDWKCEQFTFAAPADAPAFLSSDISNVKSGKRKYRSKGSAPHKRAGTKQKHKPDGTDNPAHLAQMMKRTFDRADAMLSTSYKIVRDASVSSTGWQGISPPGRAKALVRQKFRAEPDAKQLHEYICRFLPVPYRMIPEVSAERATFLVDCEDRIIMFRTYRPQWRMNSIDQVQEMIDTLVGRHLASQKLREACSTGERGPHFPCIIGYHRQSAKKPFLTSWHQKNKADVDAFLALPITQRIIKWVSSVVKLVFPGVAASFEKEAAIILEMYGISPQFGLFWNFCLNAALEGQDRIHCDPHADRKNRIGGGEKFNHFQRTWLVIWEAGVAIQLPPWVLALYPSALFYHFNIDIDELEFVYTEGNVDWPTRNNSRPVVAGDEWGRGSMVFFNQSTMTQTAFTGYPTVGAAKMAGHSGITDFGTDAQAAFSKHVIFVPVAASKGA
ncbi:hypothetical protein DFH06DRAFT_1348935 [Mycena polygramma]|nr:hypothetical protein DFH06DRAFT_1348935 [Mycena polygramma]